MLFFCEFGMQPEHEGAMTMHPGYWGGIVGGGLGLAGGVVGTYFSLKNTNGSREKRFMIKAAVVGWICISIFIALVLLLPHPYRWFLWIPYGPALVLGIRFANKRQAQIRAEESGSTTQSEGEPAENTPSSSTPTS
jgi:hypothetical protein